LLVLPASVQDRDGGCWLLAQVKGLLARVREVIADAGFSRRFIDCVREVCGWRPITTHNAPEGFKVHPRRWVVERTFGWLVRYRRLVIDHEQLPETSQAMVLAAMTHLMIRRLGPAT
jgi:putative transposase